MNKHRNTLKVVLWVGSLTLIIAGVAGVIVGNNSLRRKQDPERRKVTSLPPTSSKIPSIEVLNASLKREGTPAAAAAVEVRNNSDRDITTIMLTCGESGVEKDGLFDPGNPQVVIPARGTRVLEMGLGEMTVDCSLEVSGVTYSDGTEEGLPETLTIMHGLRDHEKAEHEAKKGKKQ